MVCEGLWTLGTTPASSIPESTKEHDPDEGPSTKKAKGEINIRGRSTAQGVSGLTQETLTRNTGAVLRRSPGRRRGLEGHQKGEDVLLVVR